MCVSLFIRVPINFCVAAAIVSEVQTENVVKSPEEPFYTMCHGHDTIKTVKKKDNNNNEP